MQDSLWTFAFEIANFVMLAGLLGWFFFKPVRNAIEQQQDEARQLEEQSKAKLAYAENIEKELNQKREHVSQELEEMRAAAKRSADREGEQIIAKARADAIEELAQLKGRKIQIEQAQARQLAKFISDKTTNVISKLLKDIDGPDLESALLQASIRQLEPISSSRLAPVSVETATELDAESKIRLCEAIHQPQDSVLFLVIPELIGGLRVSTSQGLVDASIAGLARYAEQELTKGASLPQGNASQ